MLTSNESIDDYREVTATERAAIEKSDAEWARPPQSLVEQWRLVGGDYNEATGFGEINGLTNLSAHDMSETLLSGRLNCVESNFAYNVKIRTNLKQMGNPAVPSKGYDFTFAGCVNMEIADMRESTIAQSFKRTFLSCSKLRRVLGIVHIAHYTSIDNAFGGCAALEDIQIVFGQSVSFKDSPRLTLESINYMVSNARNVEAITITLHPDCFARLTEELIAAASEKQITFVTT